MSETTAFHEAYGRWVAARQDRDSAIYSYELSAAVDRALAGMLEAARLLARANASAEAAQ